MDIAVEREARLPVDAAEAWRWLSEPALVAAWFEQPVELDLRPGGRIAFRFGDGTERGGLVEAVEPGRRLAFRWLPFERQPDGSLLRRAVTSVEWLLEGDGDAVVLRVLERPFGIAPTALARVV